MVDVAQVEAQAKADVAKAQALAATAAAEVGFVRANWGKLSAVVIASAAVGAVLALLVRHVL